MSCESCPCVIYRGHLTHFLTFLGYKNQIFVSEPVSLKIERPELEFIFRGGQSQSPWVIPNQSPRPSMRRSVSVVQNSPLAGSESPQPSKQLSKVVGMAMKADSLSKTTGKKAEPAVQARLLSRQEEANKGEKGKGESFGVRLPQEN